MSITGNSGRHTNLPKTVNLSSTVKRKNCRGRRKAAARTGGILELGGRHFLSSSLKCGIAPTREPMSGQNFNPYPILWPRCE